MAEDKQTENPWTTKKSNVVYENSWIRVKEDHVVHPSGRDGIYGVVHFFNKAIAILPIDEQHNTWLVGQYRYALNAYSWELPMGGCPPNEIPLEAAKRELLEETGIKAQEWTQLLHLYPSNSITTEEGVVFIAKNLSFHSAQPEDTEVLTVQKLPFKEVLHMVKRQEITDAICVAAILHYALLEGYRF